MRITKALYDQLIDHAQRERPNECCGMIACRDGAAVKVIEAANAERSPLRYSIDPAEQFKLIKEIEEDGLELGAIYHSHTRSPAYPSQTDINLAFYPNCHYLIVSLQDPEGPDVRAFRIDKQGVEEVELVMTD